MRTKEVSESSVDHYPVEVFPGDLNAKGTVFGGRVLAFMDKVAGYVAQRHSGMDCATLVVDSVRFLAPAKQGEVLIFKASINRVWGSSMEVGVKVLAENLQTGESRKVLSAYLTFVALDENLRSAKVPFGIRPLTKDEKRRYKEAGIRRKLRLAQKNKTR